MKKIIIVLLAVILTSACVDLDIFGQGGLQTTELPPDIVIIQNINTIPNPPINTRDQFTTSFEIKNQDNINEISRVNVQLFDFGLCEPLDSSFTPTDWEQRGGVFSYEFDSFAPQQTEFIEWIFRAPTNDQIGRLSTTCPIRFKTTYDFSAISQVDTQVISSDRLKQLQRAGEAPTFTPKQTLGRGPVKISFGFGAALPIRASDADFDSILPVFITIEDKGEGLLGDIPARTLLLKMPSGFIQESCDKFVEIGAETEGVVGGGGIGGGTGPTPAAIATGNAIKIYTNKDLIPMIRKKSPQLRCSFIVPDEDEVVVEKTYYLSANISYSYSLTNDINVEIKPTLTV